LRVDSFAFGSFPLGKAVSPKRVLPSEILVIEYIEKQIAVAVLNLKTFDDLEEN
jgi:hypothetical protein